VRQTAADHFEAVRKDTNEHVETESDWKQHSLDS